MRMRMSKLAHMHILPDHVTWQSASSRNSLVVLQLHLQGLGREDAQNRIASFLFLKQLTLVDAGAIPSRVSELSVVSPQVQQCLEIKHFSSGRIASGHLLLVHTHGQL